MAFKKTRGIKIQRLTFYLNLKNLTHHRNPHKNAYLDVKALSPNSNFIIEFFIKKIESYK
jgi:hypothetical protein